MDSTLKKFLHLQFAPPRFLAMQTAGIDISASGIKVVSLKEHAHGLELQGFGEEPLPEGAIVGGEIMDAPVVVEVLKKIAKKHDIQSVNITLPEARSYLFEAEVSGTEKAQWRTEVEQHLDEYVPLPPQEVAFDVTPVGVSETGGTRLVGVGVARRIIDLELSVFDDAHITVNAIEGESFAAPRALLPHKDTDTVLIIDVGRTTTKLVIVSHCVPLFATTLDIGGHALTLAIQKNFGVSEEEAKRIKVERGLVVGAENDEYLSVMLSTVSAIKEEIVNRLEYWQSRASAGSAHEPVTRAILVGGNATVRGLPEYLESSLKIPVELGDVFTNLAKRDFWLPPLNYTESLAYATAIGLALRGYLKM